MNSDHVRLAGTWALVSGARDGKPVPDDEAKRTRLTVTEQHHFTVSEGSIGTSATGTFTIDAGATPKTIDSTATDGPDKGKTFLGIYEVAPMAPRSEDASLRRASLDRSSSPRGRAAATSCRSGGASQPSAAVIYSGHSGRATAP